MRERAHRHAREAALLARVGELALEQALRCCARRAPCGRRASDARGHRSSARFSFHDARCSGDERRVDAPPRTASSVAARPASRSRDRRASRAATSRSTRTSRRRRPGRSARPRRRRAAPARRRAASRACAAAAGGRAGSRAAPGRGRAPRTPARRCSRIRGPSSCQRRRRRSRGRPWGRPTPYPPGMSASSITTRRS